MGLHGNAPSAAFNRVGAFVLPRTSGDAAVTELPPVNSRGHRAIEELIGYRQGRLEFINEALPFRLDILLLFSYIQHVQKRVLFIILLWVTRADTTGGCLPTLEMRSRLCGLTSNSLRRPAIRIEGPGVPHKVCVITDGSLQGQI